MKKSKLSLPAAIVWAAVILGGVYFLIRSDKELKLDACLNNARIDYLANWLVACEIQGKLSEPCKKLANMTLEGYMADKSYKEEQRDEALTAFKNEMDKCSCTLSGGSGDAIDNRNQQNKDNCFKRYPQW